ncbi:MAG: LCP family protein [Acidimicrobiales bacterium]
MRSGDGRWARRTLVIANAVVVVCLLLMASAYGYVRYRIDSIRTAKGPDLTPTSVPSSGPQAGSGGLEPENILLIGNETRLGLTPKQQQQFGSSLVYSGTLADIMMVLHLDPARRTASILSIPRDLFAPMPAGSPVGAYQKMDAALNDGANGPDNLVKAIQDDLGIPINHFIELNFNGFINSVNALGGINVYFPDPVFDAESLLYIPTPGCHHLNGAMALALVRARHLQYEPKGVHEPIADWPYDPESDLARIVRTHTFMKIVADTAKSEGLTNPLRANAFIGAVISQMTVDPGLKSQLLPLVLHYRHLDPANIPETTFPVVVLSTFSYSYDGIDMGNVEFPVQPEDNKVIEAWDHHALATPVPPKAVQVVSITGSYTAAVAAGQQLAQAGLHVVSESAGAVPASESVTLVGYHPGQRAMALYVMGHLAGAVMMQLDPSLPAGTVQVELGSTVAVTGTRHQPAPATSSTSTTTSSTSSTASTSTTTTVPTPGGAAPSSAADLQQPWDPRAC